MQVVDAPRNKAASKRRAFCSLEFYLSSPHYFYSFPVSLILVFLQLILFLFVLLLFFFFFAQELQNKQPSE